MSESADIDLEEYPAEGEDTDTMDEIIDHDSAPEGFIPDPDAAEEGVDPDDLDEESA